MKSDIIIIGGGIMGGAAAYFLGVSGRAGTVSVIEPDPTYSTATTPAGAGGVRRLMCRPENIRMSQFSLDFYANFQNVMATEHNPAELLDVSTLHVQFPLVGTDNTAFACHSPEDGWIDPQAALIGFRKKAESLGVNFLRDRVVGLETSNSVVTRAVLQSGNQLTGDIFLNTAGTWVGEIAAMTGAELPVKPMCRVQYFW